MEWKQITIRFSNRRLYRVNIKRIYAGTGLWKFEITGGNKRVEMHKHLYRKSNEWMMPKGRLNEADARFLGRVIDALARSWGQPVETKKPHPKDNHDWSGKTIDLDTIKMLEYFKNE